MKVQLTDRFCQHAKSKAVQTDYFDATVPGLALRVTSKGTKAWTIVGLSRNFWDLNSVERDSFD
jgi:hypothetical protein